MGDPTGTTATGASSGSPLGGVLSGLFSPEELESIRQLAASSAESKDKNTQSTLPSISSPTDADAKVRAFWQRTFGREPTSKELKRWSAKLIKAQQQNPATQTYKRVGDKIVQTSVSGLNENEWLTKNVTADPTYQEELQKVALTPKNVAQKAENKLAYDQAIAQASGNQSAIDSINQSSAYGLDIKGLTNRIQSEADKAGAVYDQNDLLSWAQEAYNTNQDSDPYTFQRFLDNKFKFSGAGYKGDALNSFTTLRDTAIANGLDINKSFGNQLPEWIKAINSGANIEQYKQMIRDVAKIGLPEKVSGLLDRGIDLGAIYSPYQNVMETVLELPRGSVTLDDPLLRSAIGPDKEMTIYEFQRALRKDPRWQYTDNARQEVSSATLDVLRDFGFQG